MVTPDDQVFHRKDSFCITERHNWILKRKVPTRVPQQREKRIALDYLLSKNLSIRWLSFGINLEIIGRSGDEKVRLQSIREIFSGWRCYYKIEKRKTGCVFHAIHEIGHLRQEKVSTFWLEIGMFLLTRKGIILHEATWLSHKMQSGTGDLWSTWSPYQITHVGDKGCNGSGPSGIPNPSAWNSCYPFDIQHSLNFASLILFSIYKCNFKTQ